MTIHTNILFVHDIGIMCILIFVRKNIYIKDEIFSAFFVIEHTLTIYTFTKILNMKLALSLTIMCFIQQRKKR